MDNVKFNFAAVHCNSENAVALSQCCVCKSQYSLLPKQIGVFSKQHRWLGYALALPAMLGVIAAVLLFAVSLATAPERIFPLLAETYGYEINVMTTTSLDLGLHLGIGGVLMGVFSWLFLTTRTVHVSKCLRFTLT